MYANSIKPNSLYENSVSFISMQKFMVISLNLVVKNMTMEEIYFI